MPLQVLALRALEVLRSVYKQVFAPVLSVLRVAVQVFVPVFVPAVPVFEQVFESAFALFLVRAQVFARVVSVQVREQGLAPVQVRVPETVPTHVLSDHVFRRPLNFCQTCILYFYL